MTHRVLLTALALTLAPAVGCAPPTPGGPRPDGGGSGIDAGPMSHLDAGPSTGADGGGAGLDGGDPFEECAAETTMAETGYQPVDVIWIIDRSGSMRGEADIVQDNINGFASAIGASGIDYHVVMVSAMEFVTVPPPLGTDATRFRYVEDDVQSNDGLIKLIERFADYADFLRPDAATHFVVVSDDESERMGWSDFRAQMEMRLGHAFTFHSVVSPPGSTHCEPPGFCIVNEDGCSGPNGDAAENGEEYWGLSSATGGQQLSICTEDWSGLFSSLTAAIAVARPLPCRFFLPEPPDGMTLDRMKVNVIYTPSSGGGEQVIPFVGDFTGCTGPGWYYEGDDIVTCPATCSALTADDAGRVDIALGCETVLI